MKDTYVMAGRKIMNLEETVKANRLKNGDTIHVRGRLKGGSNKPKMDIEEEKENWPNFTPTQPPPFSRRTTSMESQIKHDQVRRLQDQVDDLEQ